MSAIEIIDRTMTACPCGAPWVSDGARWEERTLVGYYSPPGHDHDDNCVKRQYACRDGHQYVLSLRRRCTVAGCGWVGKMTCGCHAGPKLDAWPLRTGKAPP